MTTLVPATAVQVDFCCDEILAAGMVASLGDGISYLGIPIGGVYSMSAAVSLIDGSVSSYIGNLIQLVTADTLTDYNTAGLTAVPFDAILGSDAWAVIAGNLVAGFTGAVRLEGAIELSNGLLVASADAVDIIFRKNGTDVLMGLANLRFDTINGQDHGLLVAYDFDVAPGDYFEMLGSAAAPIVNAVTIEGAHTFLAATRLSVGRFTVAADLYDSDDVFIRNITTTELYGSGTAVLSCEDFVASENDRVKIFVTASSELGSVADAQMEVMYHTVTAEWEDCGEPAVPRGLFRENQDGPVEWSIYSVASSLTVDEAGENLFVGYGYFDGAVYTQGIYRYVIDANGDLDLGDPNTGTMAEIVDPAPASYVYAHLAPTVAVVDGVVYAVVYLNNGFAMGAASTYSVPVTAPGGSAFTLIATQGDPGYNAPFPGTGNNWDRGTDGNIWGTGNGGWTRWTPGTLADTTIYDTSLDPSTTNSTFMRQLNDRIVGGGASGIGSAPTWPDVFAAIANDSGGSPTGIPFELQYWNIAAGMALVGPPLRAGDGVSVWVAMSEVGGTDHNVMFSPTTGTVISSSDNADPSVGLSWTGYPDWDDCSSSDDGTVSFGLTGYGVATGEYWVFKLYDVPL